MEIANVALYMTLEVNGWLLEETDYSLDKRLPAITTGQVRSYELLAS